MVRTIVQLVLINETGDSYYRMRWPGAILAKQNPTWRVISLDAQAEERFLWAEHADLLVVLQSNDIDLIPIIEARRAKGLKTLVEYNDNFYESQLWSPVAKPWRSPLVWQVYETFMQKGDRLLVTGPGLQRLFAGLTNVPIEILRNELPFDLPEFTALPAKPDSEIGIGWAGSLGHMADILWTAPVLRRLVADYSNVRIHIMGNETLPSLLRIPAERLRYVNWGTMTQYFQFWSPVHIGIAPLLNTGYNQCRSDIKAVEMSATGALPVLSRALPYEEFISRTAAPHFSTLEELEELLRKFIENPTQTRSRLESCFEYVRSERIGLREFTRSHLFESIMRESPESTFSWPLPAGYHEIKGSTEKMSRSHRVLAKVQEQWNAGARDRAIGLAAEATTLNPGNSDWSLAHLKCLMRLDESAVEGALEKYRKQFPRDLRFLLAVIQREYDRAKRLSRWEELFTWLENSNETSREFFRAEIVKVLNRELSEPEIASALVERLLNHFSFSPEYLLVKADALERQGKYKEALDVFTQLTNAAHSQEQGKEFFAAVELGYLETMREMLAGRIAKGNTQESAD